MLRRSRHADCPQTAINTDYHCLSAWLSILPTSYSFSTASLIYALAIIFVGKFHDGLR
jgi:hypothetical protein